jgi:outer membrane protein insertion porin family
MTGRAGNCHKRKDICMKSGLTLVTEGLAAVVRMGAGILISAVFISLFLIPGAAAAAVTAGKVEVRGLSSISENEFLNMLGIAPGQKVDATVVRDGIKRAFYKGIFEDIAVRVPDGENPVVEVQVREREVIGGIMVKGDGRLSKGELKRLFLMKAGQQMRYDLIGKAEAALKELLSEYGFPDAKVGVKVEKTDKPYRVDIVLDVVAGSPLLVKSIVIDLPPAYDATAIGGAAAVLGAMKLSPGAVYNHTLLDADLKRIEAFFKKQGYYSAKVGPSSFRDGDLEIRVDPGSHLSIKIEGNSAVSTADLLKETPFFEVKEFNDEVVEEAISRMLALYHRKGYAFAQIAPVIHAADQSKTITFFVFEGEKVKIRSISFAGITLPVERLKGVMSLTEGDAFNPDLVDRDKESLKEFYAALGYVDEEVKDIDTQIDREAARVSIVVEIDEGKKSEIGSVEIIGEPPGTREKLMTLVGIKPGDPYNEVDISDARFRLLDYFVNSGYMNVDVVVTRTLENYKANVVFKVVGGQEKYFGKTVIIGNEKTKYKVFKRELLYKEGQPYSFRILSEQRQRFYKLGIFSDVEIETVDGEDAEKDVLIRVTEGNAGSVEFGVGYGEFEKYRGYVEVGYRNLWGMNREGLLRVEASSLENRYILQYNEPWFLGMRLPFRIFFLYERRTELNFDTGDTLYKLQRYSVTAGVEKKLSDKLKAELYYEFSLVRTFDVQPDVILSREDTGTLAISGIKPSIIYDTRDNPFDPHEGFLAGLTMKVATFLLLSETDFIKLEAYGSNFHRLSKRITLALSVRGGVAYGLGSTEQLPIVERFFLGGRSTVRGYPQDTLGPKGADGNPTGGNAYLMGNVELRTDIGRGFGIVPFVDMGNVWLRAKDVDPMQLKFTTGLGLRYSTPVGPLRVDYGIKLNRGAGESRGEIHFSVGHAF